VLVLELVEPSGGSSATAVHRCSTTGKNYKMTSPGVAGEASTSQWAAHPAEAKKLGNVTQHPGPTSSTPRAEPDHPSVTAAKPTRS